METIKKFRKKFKTIDYWVFLPYIILNVIGIVMVFSASSDYFYLNGTTAKSYLIKQAAFAVFGVVVALLVYGMKLEKFRNSKFLKIATIFFIVAFIYLKFLGKNTNGATGWLNLGPINVQPAEMLKVFLILYLADQLASHQEFIDANLETYVKNIRRPLILTGVLLFLTVIQNDFGGMIINAVIAFVVIAAAGINFQIGIGAITFLGLIGALGLNTIASHINVNTSNYMLQRFVGFAHPFELSKGAGNQLVNSYYALGNGGVFGLGLGNSIQKKGYLPEANTDFIMSVIAEELGLIGIVVIMSLLLIIVWRAITLGIKSKSTYDTLICYGVATYYTFQSLLNVGGMSGLLPITGVTFPFISYGGSSMVILSFCIGLLLNISTRERRESELDN